MHFGPPLPPHAPTSPQHPPRDREGAVPYQTLPHLVAAMQDLYRHVTVLPPARSMTPEHPPHFLGAALDIDGEGVVLHPADTRLTWTSGKRGTCALHPRNPSRHRRQGGGVRGRLSGRVDASAGQGR